MNKSWIEEKADLFRDAVALEDSDSGATIRYGELPAILQNHDTLRTTAPGILLLREPSPWQAALRLLAGAFSGNTLLPLSPRLPGERIMELLGTWGMDSFGDKLIRSGAALARETPGQGTLLATSGSTGSPRLLFHPWSAHIANAEGASARIPLNPGDRWHINLPLWHTSGFAALFRTMHAGATAVFGSHPQSISHRSTVATQIWRELESMPPGSRATQSLRVLLAGGGPIVSSLRERAIARGFPLHVTYGLTEAASQVCTSERLAPGEPESSGKPLPNREIKIGARGAILLRGPVLARGTWNHETRMLTPLPCDAAGWWDTGDFGKLDESGRLYITGRRDRMFVCAGENIHPERIERALLEIPGISRVVVVSIADPEFGSIPAAFVDGAGSPSLWRGSLASTLSGLEIPRLWFAWPEDDELGASGLKVSPRDLETLVATGKAIALGR